MDKEFNKTIAYGFIDKACFFVNTKYNIRVSEYPSSTIHVIFAHHLHFIQLSRIF